MGKVKLVISAVNFTHGGPYTILKETLKAASVIEDIEVVALVNNSDELKVCFPKIQFIDFPEPKKSWFARIHFEYFFCKKFSEKLQATHWLCLHDMTANVVSKYRFVYCHNPAPFYKNITLKEVSLEPAFFLFKMLYSKFYGFNIHKNDAVFVQQHWLAREFERRYNIKKIIVSRPEFELPEIKYASLHNTKSKNDKIIIFYPAVTRVFKNFEVILDVAQKMISDERVEFRVTLDGSENNYSKSLLEKYGSLSNVKFLGYLTKDEMNFQYEESDILCFPSKLETWGLPISEAKMHGLWILAADLPYAHETLGVYSKKTFFDPMSSDALYKVILSFLSCQLPEIHNDAGSDSKDNEEIVGFNKLLSYILDFK